MEASAGAAPPQLPTPSQPPQDTEKIKQRLLRKGVYPTPKIIHTIRKKQLQKSLRKSNKQELSNQAVEPLPLTLTQSQKQALTEESHFQTIRHEYKHFAKAVKAKNNDRSNGILMVGKPWERLERVGLREFLSANREYDGEKLKTEYLRELREIFDERKRDELRFILDDDVEVEEGWFESGRQPWEPRSRRGGEAEAIRFLVDRLGAKELSVKDWKFSRMMKQSGLRFTEAQLMKIVERLGACGHWRNALSIVEWVYNDKERKHYKSRFVYTKLLAVLGKARRPHEALNIFNQMRGDCHIYPDMAAYHAIAVTLGQAGLLKELVKIIECMRQKPSKEIKSMRRKNWDPTLEPDLVVYNAVLNACVPARQWKGVYWVFEQLRKNGLKPNGASYGLAMEVMLQSKKYDLVHEFFRKMRRSGEGFKALTYKVLVRAFWEEDKVDEAVETVRDMEKRGVVGTACVYYELACCLCNKGRWRDAMTEVDKLKKLPHTKPLAVTFTGMIISSMEGGHFGDCVSIFEQMKDYCVPNVGTINAMLKVYGRNDMFSKAKELFEGTKRANSGSIICINDSEISVRDVQTYISMLAVSASALQWEYFETVYREMALSGYQLNQSRYAWLLVEASRGGKWYLLEHAFDTTLEAGDIPHPSFFTELICQATAQNNYGRALNLVRALAYAPFQVTEKQWIDLFEKNGERISRDGLQKLLDALENCEVAEEATISNLRRTLHSLCGFDAPLGLRGSIAFGNESSNTSVMDNDNGGFHGVQKTIMQNRSACGGEDRAISNGDIRPDVFSVHRTRLNRNNAANMEKISNPSYVCNEDRTDLSIGPEDFSDVGSANESNKEITSNENIEDDGEEGELDIEIYGNDAFNISSSPTADKILEAWKESRKRDGIYFPFQLGSK